MGNVQKPFLNTLNSIVSLFVLFPCFVWQHSIFLLTLLLLLDPAAAVSQAAQTKNCMRMDNFDSPYQPEGYNCYYPGDLFRAGSGLSPAVQERAKNGEKDNYLCLGATMSARVLSDDTRVAHATLKTPFSVNRHCVSYQKGQVRLATQGSEFEFFVRNATGVFPLSYVKREGGACAVQLFCADRMSFVRHRTPEEAGAFKAAAY